MAGSSLLDSFDPFATHPFTNNSGLAPNPPPPSQYPMPISPLLHHLAPRSSLTPHFAAIKSPQPHIPITSHGSSKGFKPIFEPFKPERRSPDLALTRQSPLRQNTFSEK